MFKYLLAAYLIFAQQLFAFGEEHGPVTVNGAEWLQPADFVDFSWADVGAVCDVSAGGKCSGLLGDHDLSGWTWAGSHELGVLFNFFIGHEEFQAITGQNVQSFFEKNGSWATAFFDAGFRPHQTVDADRYLSAYLRDDVSSPALPEFKLFGGVSAYFRPYCVNVCNAAEINESWDLHKENRPPALGYWFYRR